MKPQRVPRRRAVVLEGGVVHVLVVVAGAQQRIERPLVQLPLLHRRVEGVELSRLVDEHARVFRARQKRGVVEGLHTYVEWRGRNFGVKKGWSLCV